MADARPLHWQLRRGMRELDVMLSRWHDSRYANADESLRTAFVALLAQEDPDIWNWLMGRAEPPPEFADIVATLRGDELP